MRAVIRSMSEKDIPKVTEIERACFSVPWSEKGFRDALKAEKNIFLTASGQDAASCIFGYIGMYTAADEGEITNVAVKEEARGMGIGRQLIQCAVSAAEKTGVKNIYLEVRVSNIPAIRLYEKCGFQKCGVRKNFYSEPPENAYVMVRTL